MTSPVRAFLLAAIATFSLAQAEKTTAGLSPFLNQNLRELSENELVDFWKSFDVIATRADEEKGEVRGLDPWLVQSFQSGKTAWIFAEVYPGYDVPDVSYARVHFFDKNWKRLSVKTFPTGYRAFIGKATIVSPEEAGETLLEFIVTSSGPFVVSNDGEKKPAFEQGDFQRQFYGLVDGDLSLVRIEDETGATVMNNYRSTVPFKGGAVSKRTKEEWIKSLSSKSRVQKLATLVWLSGAHLASDKPRQKNVSQQPVEDSKLIEAVRADPQTKAALTKLAKSKNTWIKAYAELALKSLF